MASPPLSDLIDSLGAQGVITSREDQAAYCRDLIGYEAQQPLAVARPQTKQEVSAVVSWCQTHKVPLVPQGGLTGLTGAAVPADQPGAMILSLGRMNKIRCLDPLDNNMVVEAGVVLADAKAAAEAANRYFPLTHGGESSSQIGGNLSTNAGGNNALRYGTARDQVLGLEVVLPDGTLWQGLRALRKNTAGYDLKQLFLGAEGTLGIITAATLKLRPFPKQRATSLLAVSSPIAALMFLRHLEDEVGEVVSACELLSARAVAAALTVEGTDAVFAEAHDWLLLLELESPSRLFDLSTALEGALVQPFEQDLVIDAVLAQNEQQRLKFWRLRESIAFAFIENHSCYKGDTAVPVGAVPEYLKAARQAVEEAVPGAQCAPFGHLGDGNIHFNVLKPETMSHEGFRQAWPRVARAIEETALALAGTISAEHGIGRLKRLDFEQFQDDAGGRLRQQLKKALDPNGLMNPGVLFDPLSGQDG